MKVFISWSGERSRQVAEVLNRWLPLVTENVEPWLSTHDIASGSQWFSEITQNLEATTQGIFCITNENKNKPWILFEAGALAKGSQKSRVYTFLIDLGNEDIEDPLAQFNHTFPLRKESVWSLIKTINENVEIGGEHNHRETVLRTLFDAKWQIFETEFAQVLIDTESVTTPAPRRDTYDIVAEVLEAVRGIDKQLAEGQLLKAPGISHAYSATANDISSIASKMSNALGFYIGSQAIQEHQFPSHKEGIYSRITQSLPEIIFYYGRDAFDRAFEKAVNNYYASKRFENMGGIQQNTIT
jgi:hypothetical protein